MMNWRKSRQETGPSELGLFPSKLPERTAGPKVRCCGLNDMDEEHGHGYTSRRGISGYREVAEVLSKDFRAILNSIGMIKRVDLTYG